MMGRSYSREPTADRPDDATPGLGAVSGDAAAAGAPNAASGRDQVVVVLRYDILGVVAVPEGVMIEHVCRCAIGPLHQRVVETEIRAAGHERRVRMR